MPQPIGPQAGAGEWLAPDPPPTRAAAGADIFLPTSALPQAGQRTSASSDLRRTSSSKLLPHGAQAYS